MQKTVCDLVVMDNVQLNHDNYIIELQSAIQLTNIIPGQFVNVLVREADTTFLRRPFSIHDVDYVANSFSILVKTVGNGTRKLAKVQKGDKVDAVFPLGNGFSRPKKVEKILLIGGGVGIAPMMQMARESKELGADVHILLGARTIHDHILIDAYAKHGTVHITTDDGSLGTKGFVVHHEIFGSNMGFDRIYCCGPDPMMHAVAKKAKALNIDCEVSLENMMACGYGVCLCCVTKTTQGNKCICTEGPIFNINDLLWQI